MRAPSSASLTALRLYGSLLDRDPPAGFSEERWDRLIGASWHLYLVAALHHRRGASDLAELTRAARDCMDLLEAPGVAADPVPRAWMCLRVMLDELGADAPTRAPA